MRANVSNVFHIYFACKTQICRPVKKTRMMSTFQCIYKQQFVAASVWSIRHKQDYKE